MEDQALLKAYITEWRKFFEQCSYLPKPFSQVEVALNNQSGSSQSMIPKKHKNDDSDVRKVCGLLYFIFDAAGELLSHVLIFA